MKQTGWYFVSKRRIAQFNLPTVCYVECFTALIGCSSNCAQKHFGLYPLWGKGKSGGLVLRRQTTKTHLYWRRSIWNQSLFVRLFTSTLLCNLHSKQTLWKLSESTLEDPLWLQNMPICNKANDQKSQNSQLLVVQNSQHACTDFLC